MSNYDDDPTVGEDFEGWAIAARQRPSADPEFARLLNQVTADNDAALRRLAESPDGPAAR